MTKKLNIPGLEINKYQWLSLLMQSALGNGAKLRGFAIYSFTNDQGFAWPNQLDIEKAIGGKSISRTSQFTKQLEKAGWIKINHLKIDAMKSSNNFQLTLPYTREAGY